MPADNALGLAEGIEHALQGLGKLAATAAAEGPAFVGKNHTFGSYVNALLAETPNNE